MTFTTDVIEDGNATVRSSLAVDIVLEWRLAFLQELGLSFNDILADVGVTGDELTGAINALLGDVIPADGFGLIPFDGVIRFQSGIGLERTVYTPENVANGTDAFEGTSCFMLGTSGLKMGFSGGTEGNVVAFDGMLGPFSGTFGIDLNFLDGSGALDGLSLDVGLDPSLNYSIDVPSYFPSEIPTRTSFVAVSTVADLLGSLSGSWAGGIKGSLTSNIPAIDVDLNLDMDFPDLETLIRVPKIAIFDILDTSTKTDPGTVGGTLSFSVASLSSLGRLTDLSIPAIGDLMLGDGAFSNFVDSVQQFFNRIDSATFGSAGFITSIDVPFLKKKIATSLGAGSGGTGGSSVFKQAGAKIASAFDDALDTLVGELGGTIAVEVASLLNDALADYLVPEKEVEAICGCEGDDGIFLSGDDCPCEENDGSIASIEWKIPLGGSALRFEIPLDFELDASFALDLNFTQEDDEPIVLDIGWSFLLGIGYDLDTGLFFDTFPDEGSEVSIEALLDVSSPYIGATLLNFLEANLTETTCQIAAGFFIDFDKEAGLRLAKEENSTSRSYGRMSLTDFKGISTDFFQPSVRAAATFGTSMELKVSGDLIGDTAAAYIPSLKGEVGAVLFKEIGSNPYENTTTSSSTLAPTTAAAASGASKRRLERRLKDVSSLGQLSSDLHPSRHLMEAMRSLAKSEILEDGYDFSSFCDLPADDASTGCLAVKDLGVDTNKLQDVFTPIIEIFVKSDNTGALDELAQPILPLNDPIPGLSDLTGKEMTILDAGEAYPKAAKGVSAVRKFISTYEAIKEFVEGFAQSGIITIAETCDVLAGFNCTGGLFASSSEESAAERRLHIVEDAQMLFSKVDKAGLPLSPADNELRRRLAPCKTTDAGFDPEENCEGECNSGGGCTSTAQKAKCRAAQVKCKANSIDGLSFPFLEDPTLLLGLISGEDFVSMA